MGALMCLGYEYSQLGLRCVYTVLILIFAVTIGVEFAADHRAMLIIADAAHAKDQPPGALGIALR